MDLTVEETTTRTYRRGMRAEDIAEDFPVVKNGELHSVSTASRLLDAALKS